VQLISSYKGFFYYPLLFYFIFGIGKQSYGDVLPHHVLSGYCKFFIILEGCGWFLELGYTWWVTHPCTFLWPTKLTSKFSGCTHVPSYLPEFCLDNCHLTCFYLWSCTILLLFDKFGCHFGPLYTMSQGQCSTQIKHSYWCKSWNWPQGLHTRNQGWNWKNIFSICPKLLINAELYGLVLASRLKKGYHRIWEANLQPLGGQCFSIY